MAYNLFKFLVGRDIYGHQINVNCEGEDKHKTGFGAVLTLATYVLIMINLVNKLTEFGDRSTQDEITRPLKFDLNSKEEVSLQDGQILIGVLSVKKPQPKFGEWKAVLSHGSFNYKESVPLVMKPCSELDKDFVQSVVSLA